jgi:hypothetical protein
VVTITIHELFSAPNEKGSAFRANNRDLQPFLFTFITAKFMAADLTAHRAFIQKLLNMTFGWEALFLQYLINPLP